MVVRLQPIFLSAVCYRQVLPATALMYRNLACWKTHKPEIARTNSNIFQPIKIHYYVSWFSKTNVTWNVSEVTRRVTRHQQEHTQDA